MKLLKLCYLFRKLDYNKEQILKYNNMRKFFYIYIYIFFKIYRYKLKKKYAVFHIIYYNSIGFITLNHLIKR